MANERDSRDVEYEFMALNVLDEIAADGWGDHYVMWGLLAAMNGIDR